MSVTTPLTPGELTKWKKNVDDLSSFEEKVLNTWKLGNTSMNTLTTSASTDISKIGLASDTIGEKIQPL